MAEVPEQLRSALRGRYDLQRELGRGGMASVYLARDLRYDRYVAIKVLDPELVASVGRARFLREIQIAAQLSHPHILPLLDSGEAGDLLYYVMPYVEGESLKDRIEREKQVPIREAVAIAREVAAGLGHAHGQGIVHRDVKPGNILLSGGSAVIADFGIARAVRRSATDDTLTDVNLAIGTPAYMSPEQWSGTRELDARSDIYSLGCVVYEMLAGQPPFTGSTTEAIAARVAVDPVPPIRTVRPRVSRALERAILRALEKVPADRFATVSEFADALAAAPGHEKPPIPPMLRWTLAAAGGVALLAAARSFVPPLIGGGPAVADTTTYAVLPFQYEDGLQPTSEDRLLRDALARWTGITLSDEFRVREAVARRGGGVLTAREALSVAKGLGAGRYVRATMSIVGDSVRVYAVLHDATKNGAVLREAALRLSDTQPRAEAVFTMLGDSLLFESEVGIRLAASGAGTSSAPARRAFAHGHGHLGEWELAAADSAFADAARYDPGFARAHLWLALVREWAAEPTETWRSAIERAATARRTLPRREAMMADAVLAAARGQGERACLLWSQLAAGDSTDFASWYGTASCLTADSVVLRDRGGQSGWRFRSSYHQAVRAYQRAFQLLPSIHKALRTNSFESVRQLLYTSGTRLRRGRAAPPDTGTFLAYPSQVGDTLAFVPFRARDFFQVRTRVVPTTRPAAVRRQRQQFRSLAMSWVAAFPNSADAMLALAVSMDLLGDEAAIDTVRRARTLATSQEEGVRAAGAEFWMRVKYALPEDLDALRATHALGDSITRATAASGLHPLLRASIAALAGRATEAAAASRQAAQRGEWTVPAALTRTAPALAAFAAVGGPEDSLRSLEQSLEAAIPDAVEASERGRAREEWLERAAALAFPVFRFASIGRSEPRYYVVRAQLAAVRGDTSAVRRLFAELHAARRTINPADVTVDAAYAESWALAAIGDTSGAIAWLDPVLAAVRATGPEAFVEVQAPGALVRAMAFRAELAASVGDRPAAARWANAVRVLWSDGEDFLRPLLQRMETIARWGSTETH